MLASVLPCLHRNDAKQGACQAMPERRHVAELFLNFLFFFLTSSAPASTNGHLHEALMLWFRVHGFLHCGFERPWGECRLHPHTTFRRYCARARADFAQ